MRGLDLTIVICTRDRAESLRVTLQHLARADRSNLQCEAVVVDNASRDHTRQVTAELAHALPVRYLYEPASGNNGKSHALNCALAAGGLGELVVVLDDDMSVEAGWYQGVLAISRRWPNADFFTGRSYVIWPSDSIPAWAHHPGIKGWIYSVEDCVTSDDSLPDARWFSGNHFWFRSRLIEGGRRFEDIWLTSDAAFMLQLVKEGYRGARGPDAAVGHRIQPALLDPGTVLERAERTGRAYAEVRLDPRFNLRHSRLAREHPLLARAYAAGQWLRWRALARWRRNVARDSFQFGSRLVAVEREANLRATWQILNRLPEYRLST